MNRVIIADDEPLLRFHLQKALSEVWPEAEVLAQAANGEEALALIEELKPDVAFLDIHMPGLSGLEVAVQVAKKNLSTKVVFLTAFDEHAVEAFDQGAVDYLLKPLDETRLQKTIERLQTYASNQQGPDEQLQLLMTLVQQKKPEKLLSHLNVQQGDNIHVVAVPDVLYFKAEDKYTTVYTANDNYLIRLTIKQLEAQLDDKEFWLIHRGTLVNASQIERVEKTLQGSLQLFVRGLKEPLPVSRAKQSLFKAH